MIAVIYLVIGLLLYCMSLIATRCKTADMFFRHLGILLMFVSAWPVFLFLCWLGSRKTKDQAPTRKPKSDSKEDLDNKIGFFVAKK